MPYGKFFNARCFFLSVIVLVEGIALCGRTDSKEIYRGKISPKLVHQRLRDKSLDETFIPVIFENRGFAGQQVLADERRTVLTLHSREGKEPDSEMISELNRVIVELPPAQPVDFPDEVFQVLDSEFKKSKIIGLGEATHGTEEFSQLKYRLFRYLVEFQGVNALAFEIEYWKSLMIEKYIVSGVGDIDSITGSFSWIVRTENLLALIKWMREYNNGKPYDRMIHFIGIDNQADIFYIDDLEKYLSEYSNDLFLSVSGIMAEIKGIGKIVYQGMPDKEFSRIESLFVKLKAEVIRFFSAHLDCGSEHEQKLLIHLVDAYVLSHQQRYFAAKKESRRDLQMAENVLWIREFLGKDARIAVWAHNAHVAVDPEYTRWGFPSMGKYLRDRLKDSYLSIGTSFSNGRFAAVTDDCFGRDTQPIEWLVTTPPLMGSANQLFHMAEHDRFLLNVRFLNRSGNIFKYLNRQIPFLGIGDFFSRNIEEHYQGDRIINVRESFDTIFFFRETTAVRIRKKNENQ